MGRLVAHALRHVSYGEFYGALQRVAYQLVELSEQTNERIVLYIADNVGKSNTWVVLLVWPIIRDRVVYVTNTLTPNLFEQARIPAIVAYVDDGSFSGSQIVQNLNSNILRYFSDTYVFCIGCYSYTNCQKCYKQMGEI
jgi:hypothetical protein